MFSRARPLRVLAILALLTTMATSRPLASFVAPGEQDTFTDPDVRVTLTHDNEALRQRAADAARQIAAVCRTWFGAPLPDATVSADPSLIDVPETMAVEAHVALTAARLWSNAAMGFGDNDHAFAEGLARYLHAIAVENLFDARYRRRAYSQHAERLFGGFVAVPTRGIYVRRHSALAPGRQLGEDAALIFQTLERLLSQPRLQRAVREATVTPPRDSQTFVTRLEGALGQDVRWLFDDVSSGRGYDYALDGLTTSPGDCADGPCYRTGLVLKRRGEAQFTGSNDANRYQQGRLLQISVLFENGDAVATSSGGRQASEELWFESAFPATSATLDPSHIVALDRARLDNFQTLAPKTNINVSRWTAQWAGWLEHTLLTSAFFF